MKTKYEFLVFYADFDSTEDAFNKIGVTKYKKRDKIVQKLIDEGYVVEQRKGVILRITTSGHDKIRELRKKYAWI